MDKSDLVIIKNGKEYLLQTGWSLSDSGSYEFRNKLQDRAFAHGSDMVGDGKIEGRIIQVEFDLQGATEQEHDAAVNGAYTYFGQTNYDLYVGRNDRLYHVAGLSKIKHKFQKGFKQRWSNVKVSLLLADPFRYAAEVTEMIAEYDSVQEDAAINVNNPSSVDVPLIWTFIPPEGNSVPDITVKHIESGQIFSLKDTLLTAPAVAVVNGEAGTVRRDTGNSINTFSGLFLHAHSGVNTFKYTGAACMIKISFTARWFV